MNPFDSDRRNLLKLSSMGLAASAGIALPAFAKSKHDHGSPTTPSLFDIRAYGAVGDGKAIDSPAINKAIEAAAAAGGGTVVIPAGNFLCFSVRLKSNVGLYLAQGSTITAADSPLPGQTTGYMGGTYDAAESNAPWEAYQDYGHNHWHNSLLWGEDLSNISITGPGLIFGKGLSFGARGPARGDYPIYVAEQAGVANKCIALKNCRNAIFRDFSILKGGHFGLLLTGTDNVTIDNLKIDTDRDGIDIDCCQNVRISNCTVNSPWDDAICPKSSYALGYPRITSKLTITGCVVSGCYELGTVLDGTFKQFPAGGRVFGTGRIKCGTESNGGFQDITITGCIFEGCHGLALETVDGGLVEGITVTNLTMRNLISSPLFMRLGARLRGPAASTTKAGMLRRVLISNLVSYNTASRISSILSGIPGHAIEDVKLDNVLVQHAGGGLPEWAGLTLPEDPAKYPEPTMFGPTPSQGFFLRHIDRIEMSHVEVQPAKPDPRPSFYLAGVHRADFISVTAPTDPPAFAFHDTAEVRIRVSRAANDLTL